MTAVACHSSMRALADDCFGSFAPKPSSALLGWCLGPNFENSHDCLPTLGPRARRRRRNISQLLEAARARRRALPKSAGCTGFRFRPTVHVLYEVVEAAERAMSAIR